MSTLRILSIPLLSILFFWGCANTTAPLDTIPVAENRPLGVDQDFLAVFESLDGQFRSETHIIQQGENLLFKKTSASTDIRCDKTDGLVRCTSGTGTAMSEEESEKALRIEYMTARRLIGRERVLPEDTAFTRNPLPTNLPLFSATTLPEAFRPFVSNLPTTRLENCFTSTSEEETELYCFGGELMPYWINTTSTQIGNLTSARFLKAYIPLTLTETELQNVKRSL